MAEQTSYGRQWERNKNKQSAHSSMVEQTSYTRLVPGSSPGGPTGEFIFIVGERTDQTAKRGVEALFVLKKEKT